MRKCEADIIETKHQRSQIQLHILRESKPLPLTSKILLPSHSRLGFHSKSLKSCFNSTSKRLEQRTLKGLGPNTLCSEVSFTEQNLILNLLLKHRSRSVHNDQIYPSINEVSSSCISRQELIGKPEISVEGRQNEWSVSIQQQSSRFKKADIVPKIGCTEVQCSSESKSSKPISELMLPFILGEQAQEKLSLIHIKTSNQELSLEDRDAELDKKTKSIKKCSATRRILGSVIDTQVGTQLNLLENSRDRTASNSISPNRTSKEMASQVLKNRCYGVRMVGSNLSPIGFLVNESTEKLAFQTAGKQQIHSKKYESSKENLSPATLVKTCKKTKPKFLPADTARQKSPSFRFMSKFDDPSQI